MILEFSSPSLQSAAWECPKCGRLWAVLNGRRGTSRLYHFCDCPQCGIGSLFSDTWHANWEEILDGLPQYIKVIEVIRITNWYLKGKEL